MKKSVFIFLLFTFFATIVKAQTKRALKKGIELIMPKEVGEENAGSNGATIVWHPVQGKYYAAMAGNENYPLAIFNGAGKRLSSDEMTTLLDVRGLWYNPSSKAICGNGYSYAGWFQYILDPKGAALDLKPAITKRAQPTDQAVGTFNTKTNEVMFLNGNRVELYSKNGSISNYINLRFLQTEKDDIGEKFVPMEETPEDYNFTSLIYTGIRGAEIGVLNTYEHQIELYDAKKGFLTTVLTLPASQKAYSLFSFAFSNDLFWLFDKDKRTWTSYK